MTNTMALNTLTLEDINSQREKIEPIQVKYSAVNVFQSTTIAVDFFSAIRFFFRFVSVCFCLKSALF